MVYYYGGKFNPFTKGHASVLKGLCDQISARKANPFTWDASDKVVVGVKDGDDALARILLVETALRDLGFTVRNAYGPQPQAQDNARIAEVVLQGIGRTWAYFQSKPVWWPDDGKVALVLGEDEYDAFNESLEAEENGASPEAGKWHHAKDIYKTVAGVLSFDRDFFVSSTRVREIFRANPFVPYCDVADYLQKPVFDTIIQRRLYWQMGWEEDARREENLFLKAYDMTKFPRPSCTATMLMVASDVDSSKVLLVRRGGHPYKGFWALPGGFFDPEKDESLEDTASRELREETDWNEEFLPHDQFRTYSGMGIDPRGRIVDHVYAKAISRPIGSLYANDDADEVAWWPINKLPRLAFHHRQVIEDWARENICKEKH